MPSPRSPSGIHQTGCGLFPPKGRTLQFRIASGKRGDGGGKPAWQKVFEKLEGFFNKRFGPGWKEKDRFFKEFEEEVKTSVEV
jgi:hypothetical protein